MNTEAKPDLPTQIRLQHLAARSVLGFYLFTMVVPAGMALSRIDDDGLTPITPTIIGVFGVSLLALVFARGAGRRAARKRQERRPTGDPRLRAAEMDATTRIVGGAAITAGAHINLLTAMGIGRWLPLALGLLVGLSLLRFWRQGSGMPLESEGEPPGSDAA